MHVLVIFSCVASYEQPSLGCRRLSLPGQSYRSDRLDQTLHVTPDVGFVCWESSLAEQPVCRFYRLLFSVSHSVGCFCDDC